MRKINILTKLLGMVVVLSMSISMSTFASEKKNFNPLKFELDSLPNGLHIIYHVDKSAPVVATVVHYKVGSKDEDPSKTGYAHFFEHLMFEATNNIPRASIGKLAEEAGGSINAYTAFDQTVFHFEIPSNEIKLALWVESQRMRSLKVDSIGVATQKGVVIEELKMRTQNQPYGSFLVKLCNHLFEGSSYGWPVIGSIDHIEKAEIQDFKNFYDNFYQPNNATLVIAGDFDIKDAKKYVRDYFGPLPSAPLPKRHAFNMPELTEGYREVIQDEKAQLPAVMICYRGTSLGDEDNYAMALLSDILASGESSRLYQRLVDKDQIAVGTEMYPFALQYTGALAFIGVAAPGKDYKDVEKAMSDEIHKLIKNGITDEELTKAKNIKEASFVNSKKNCLEKAQDLARYYSFYNDASLVNTEIDKFNAVTKEDILRVAQKYFDTDKFIVLTYVPAEKK